jgi:hypothetical protein
MKVQKLRKTFFAIATTIVLLGVIQPGISYAQTSGVGHDGITRLMWRGTDGSFSLWRLNQDLTFASYKVFGPVYEWTPVALTVGSDNNTYVLWRSTNGAAAIWRIDPTGTSAAPGPELPPTPGWIPESLSISQDGNNNLRVIWKSTSGRLSVWDVDHTTLQLKFYKAFAPSSGWDPGGAF